MYLSFLRALSMTSSVQKSSKQWQTRVQNQMYSRMGEMTLNVTDKFIIYERSFMYFFFLRLQVTNCEESINFPNCLE